MIRTITDTAGSGWLEGRRMPAMDGRYLKAAEDNLYAELSIAMEIPRSAPQRIYGGTDGRIKRSAAGALKYVRRCGCRNVTEITD